MKYRVRPSRGTLLLAFLTQTAWTLAALVLLGIAGGSASSMLRANRPYALLMAPLCGLLLLPPLVTVLYTAARLSFAQSAGVAVAITAIATLTTAWRLDWKPRDILVSLVALMGVCAVAALISTAATIAHRAPSVLYTDGTDHAGYAHLADWLIAHGAAQRPIATPDEPYQSWPELVFREDPRLSSFVAVALVALMRRTSGLFAYDLACAIALASGTLGVAAVFARSPRGLLVLAGALFLTVWFDYGRAGFFGKLTAYPGALFLIGILVTTKVWDARTTCAFGVMAVGAATLHSAYSTVLFMLAVGGPFVLARILLERQRLAASEPPVLVLVMGVVVVLASSGMFAKVASVPVGFPMTETWHWILPRLFEIQTPTLDVVPWSAGWLEAATVVAVIMQIALSGLAAYRRDARALALLAGPGLIAIALALADQRWVVHQMTGCIVAFSACALAGWLDEAPLTNRSFIVAVAILCVAFAAIRLPRAVASLDRYAVRPIASERYRASDVDALVALIGSRTVLVDIAHGQPALVVLLELGRRVAHIQWSPQAWNTILAYRQWKPPVYSTAPDFWLGGVEDPAPDGRLVFQGTRLRLIQLR